MRILPYLSTCCAVLAARFSNFTIFECSHRCQVITYTNDIFNNKCRRPHYTTRKISNLYIENKYHQLTLQKIPITFEQGCRSMVIFQWSISNYKCSFNEWNAYKIHKRLIRISNCIHCKVRGEITYPFPHVNGKTVEILRWIYNFNPHFIRYVITYACWD